MTKARHSDSTAAATATPNPGQKIPVNIIWDKKLQTTELNPCASKAHVAVRRGAGGGEQGGEVDKVGI